MRKNANIEINGFYTCKVTNKEVTVQILASSPKGGWEALNTKTGKKIHIKGPERLIKKVAAPKSKGIKNQEAPKKKAAKKTASKKPAQKKATKSSKDKLSLLDAAVIVLEKKSPLSCKELIQRMAEAGLWESTAATPANTLHAAISKEIRIKGDQSRFEKVDRGQFSLKSNP